MKKAILIALVLIAGSSLLFAGGSKEQAKPKVDPAIDVWMKEAQIGPYQPAEENWDEIIKAAQAEGEIVLYADTSRISKFQDAFEKEYGVKIVYSDLGAAEIKDKLKKLQDSNVYEVDVITCGDTPELYAEFVDFNRLFKYVPREVEAVMFDQFKDEKLGIQRLGGKAIAYNTEVYPDGSPVDSWWDLTRPEWKGKLIMKDPMLGGSDMNNMAMFIRHADDMAKAYKAEFGKDIVLSEGCPTAGHEFIKRLLKNDIIFEKGGNDAISGVGAKGQTNPPLGIISPSKMRVAKEEGLNAALAWDVKPFSTFLNMTAVAIPVHAKHPNAAKLFIKYFYGDEKGGLGFKPYNTIGNWSVRKDVKVPEGQKPFQEINAWREDGDWLYNNVIIFRDFWMKNM